MERQRHMAGGTLRMTRVQWELLSERMHGEDNGGWIMSSHYKHLGGTYKPCVAITLGPGDVGTLSIWLAHIVEVTADPLDSSTDLEDLRYLADQVWVHRPHDFTYPTYYLPCVTVEKGVTDDAE